MTAYRSLQVDAGMEVGLREQVVMLIQFSNVDRLRERWEIPLVYNAKL